MQLSVGILSKIGRVLEHSSSEIRGRGVMTFLLFVLLVKIKIKAFKYDMINGRVLFKWRWKEMVRT